jgi:integrase
VSLPIVPGSTVAEKLLTDRACRNARADSKPIRLADGGGLFLFVSPSGVKSWQLRYRNAADKWQTATLGRYPDVTLADARTRAADARNDAAAGHNLTTLARVRRMDTATASATTFESVAKDWADSESSRRSWTADYRDEVDASLRNHGADLFELPVASITAAMVYPLLDRVERNAPNMARKVSFRVHAILDHAVISGAMPSNTIPRRKHARIDSKNLPAITTLPELGTILRAAENAEACHGVRRAHLLAVFTLQRMTPIVEATWDQFDLDAGTWTIPRDSMKVKSEARADFVCPLPGVLLDDLRKWHSLKGAQRFVCPAPRDPEGRITREAVEKFYRRTLNLAGQHSPHSWRSAFKTVGEEHGKDSHTLEMQLDHVVGSDVARAYDRSARLDARRELVEWWAGKMIAARDGAQVIQIGRVA